jgi:hypothetical protein
MVGYAIGVRRGLVNNAGVSGPNGRLADADATARSLGEVLPR